MPELNEAQQQIQTASFFKGLNADAVQRAIAHVVARYHPEGQVILLENDWGNSVYFILSGWVKVRTYNLEGKEVTLNILGKGEMFGEMASLDLITRSTDIITLTEANICSLPAIDFMYLLENEATAGIRLARLLARRLRQVNRRLRLREADSTSRVADILLFLAEGQGVASESGIVIPNLPHRELSSLSGLARETVTRSLGKLEKKNLIRRDQEKDLLCIVDLNGLEALMV